MSIELQLDMNYLDLDAELLKSDEEMTQAVLNDDMVSKKFSIPYKVMIRFSKNPIKYKLIRLDTVDILPLLAIVFMLRIFPTSYFQHVYIEHKAFQNRTFYGIAHIKNETESKLLDDTNLELKIINLIREEWKQSNLYIENISPKLAKRSLDYIRYANEDTFSKSELYVIPVIEEYHANHVYQAPEKNHEGNMMLSELSSFLDYISELIEKKYVNHRGVHQIFNKKLDSIKDAIRSENPQELAAISAENHNSSFLNVELQQLSESQEHKKSTLTRFGNAIYTFIAYNITLLFYLSVIALQIASRGLITFPVTLMVFLWGGLSIPIPFRRFWTWMQFVTYSLIVSLILYEIVAGSTDFKGNKISFLFGFDQTVVTKIWASIILVEIVIIKNINKKFGIWVESYPEPKKQDQATIQTARPSTQTILPRTSTQVDMYALPLDPTQLHAQNQNNNNPQQQQQGVDEIEPNIDELRLLNTENSDSDEFGNNRKKSLFTNVKKFCTKLFDERKRSSYSLNCWMHSAITLAIILTLLHVREFSPKPVDGNIIDYLSYNFIPITFIIFLMIHFSIIVIDHCLLLRRFMMMKIVFYIVLVLVINIYVFIALPLHNKQVYVNKRNTVIDIWYFILCSYLLISSSQIIRGYPMLTIREFYCQRFNSLSLLQHYAYTFAPFLHMTRVTIDWMLTPTALNLTEFISLEDIYILARVLKVNQKREQDVTEQFSPCQKSVVGCVIVMFFVLCIFAPLVFFASRNVFFQPSVASNAVLEFGLKNMPPMFLVYSSSLKNLERDEYNRLQLIELTNSNCTLNKGFFERFDYKDIQLIEFNLVSAIHWKATNFTIRQLKESLADIIDVNTTEDEETSFKYYLKVTLEKSTDKSSSKYKSFEKTIGLDVNGSIELLNWLNNSNSQLSLNISDIIPSAIVDTGIEIKNASINFFSPNSNDLRVLKTIQDQQTIISVAQPSYRCFVGADSGNKIKIVIFNHKKANSLFSRLTSLGIVGLYLSVVIVVERLFRSYFFYREVHVLFYDDLSSDPILDLFYQLALVRKKQIFELENFIAAKIFCLFKSPSFRRRYLQKHYSD